MLRVILTRGKRAKCPYSCYSFTKEGGWAGCGRRMWSSSAPGSLSPGKETLWQAGSLSRTSPRGTLQRGKALLIKEETAIHAVKRRPKGWVGPLALPTPSQGGPISQVHASAFTHKAGSPPLICQPSSHINFAQPPVSRSASALRPLHSLLVTQSCLTLCDHLDCNPSGSSVHGVLQARIPESIPFSRGYFQPRDRTWVSCTAGKFFTVWATS